MRTSVLAALVGGLASASAHLKIEPIARISSPKSLERGHCGTLDPCVHARPGSYVPDSKTFFLPHVHNKLGNHWGLCKNDAYCKDQDVYSKVKFNFKGESLVFDFEIPGAHYEDVEIRIQRESPPTDASPKFNLHSGHCHSNHPGGLSCSLPFSALDCKGVHGMCPAKDEGGWVFYVQIKVVINLHGERITLYNQAIEKATGTCWFSFSYCCTKCPDCPPPHPPPHHPHHPMPYPLPPIPVPCPKPHKCNHGCNRPCPHKPHPKPGHPCHKPHCPRNEDRSSLASHGSKENTAEVKVPEVKVPGVKVSEAKLPGVKLGDVKISEGKLPGIELPQVKAPAVKGPEVDKVPRAAKAPEAVKGSSLVKLPQSSTPKHEIDVACQTASVIIFGQGANSHRLSELGGYPGHEECKNREGHYHTYVKHDLEVTIAGALELNNNAFGSFVVEFDKYNKDTEIIIKIDVWNALYYVVEAAAFIECQDGIEQGWGGRHGAHICRPETFPYWYVDEKGIGNYDFHIKDDFRCKGNYVFALWVKVCIADDRSDCQYHRVPMGA